MARTWYNIGSYVQEPIATRGSLFGDTAEAEKLNSLRARGRRGAQEQFRGNPAVLVAVVDGRGVGGVGGVGGAGGVGGVGGVVEGVGVSEVGVVACWC